MDIDTQTWSGWTALHYAAAYGHYDIARRLLERGARPFIRPSCSSSPPPCSGYACPCFCSSLPCSLLLAAAAAHPPPSTGSSSGSSSGAGSACSSHAPPPAHQLHLTHHLPAHGRLAAAGANCEIAAVLTGQTPYLVACVSGQPVSTHTATTTHPPGPFSANL